MPVFIIPVDQKPRYMQCMKKEQMEHMHGFALPRSVHFVSWDEGAIQNPSIC